MNVNSQWIKTKEKHIDPQIILKPFNQMWRCYVLLCDPSSILITILNYLFTVSRKKDSLTLCHVIWFYNISLLSLNWSSLFIYEVISEITMFWWQHPSFWKKLKLLRVQFCKLHQILGHVVFLSNLVHARKLINFLIWLHLCEKVNSDAQIVPGYIVILI